MNKIYYLVIAVAALVSFVSCNNDTDLDHKSIFPDGVDKTTQNEFDLWVDAYNELMGRDFLRQYSPRMIQLIGSAEYKEDSSEVLGTAEGGMKIFFNKVNLLDLKKPDMSIILRPCIMSLVISSSKPRIIRRISIRFLPIIRVLAG